MSLPNNALVLVADGRKMLFLRNHGDANQIDLRTETHDERADAKTSDMGTDGPGTNDANLHARTGTQAQSGGYGRPAVDQTDYHQQAEDRWARDAAGELNRRVLAHDFESLAIIAPPRLLGELRKHLHKEVERRVVCTIDKEMSGRPTPDIEALIVSETAPTEPADI